MAQMIIDACTQIGSGDRAGDVLESGITVAQVLANMDAAHVDQSVLYATTWSDYGRANAEVAEAIRTNPRRFIGFARVNPTVDGAEHVLITALDRFQFRGIRLRPYHDGYALSHPAVRRVLAIARERSLPVALDGERNKDTLVGLVQEYDDVPVILLHLGAFDNWVWKNTLEYVPVLRDRPNFYLGSCFEIIHFLLEDLIRKVPTKVVFGSDSPTLPPIMELTRIKVMHLEPEHHALVVGGNLQRILGAVPQTAGKVQP
jgi:predicted TIM-barrel fold metal-dependent hydrolase